jgi:hypothetical protein
VPLRILTLVAQGVRLALSKGPYIIGDSPLTCGRKKFQFPSVVSSRFWNVK